MRRSRALDILRAIAIILVLGRHIKLCPLEFSVVLHMITALWQRVGWIGVDLFFVISGFLISGLLFDEHKRFNHISFKHFFIRRGFKIYPAFYFFLAIAVTSMLLRKEAISHRQLGSELFFLQDYIKGLFGYTWSLAVEEQFYLLLPPLLICLYKARKPGHSAFGLIPIIFIFVGLTCLFLRILTSRVPYRALTNLFPFHLRIDSLFFGVTISYFYHYHRQRFTEIARRFKGVFFILGLALLAPVAIFELEETVFMYTLGLTLFYIGNGLILISFIESNFDNNPFFKILSSVGLYSYSIYLWHMPMVGWVDGLAGRFLGPLSNWMGYLILYFFGSIFLGIIMAKIIEYPMLRLRDRLFPSRSKPI